MNLREKELSLDGHGGLSPPSFEVNQLLNEYLNNNIHLMCDFLISNVLHLFIHIGPR